MAGLMQAALEKGVEVVGVAAPDPASLTPPYIAFVHDNHYLLVREATGEGAVVADGEGPEVTVPWDAFRRTWSGKALVAARGADVVARLDGATLAATVGGQDTIPNGAEV